jgi:hypothetical protein
MTSHQQASWDSCPSDFTLQRLRANELPRTGAGHLDQCPSCQRRLALMAAPPPPLDLPAVLRAASAARPSWRPGFVRRWLLAAAAGAAVAAILVVLPGRPANQTKGTAFTLSVIARTGDGSIRRIEPGARLRPGDQLRFEVSTLWPRAGVALVSMDGQGRVSALAPAHGIMTTVEGGRRVLLEEAVELDDTPGPERIWLVACEQPMAIASVMEAARAALLRAGGDPGRVQGVGTGCHEESVWIERVRP